MRVTIQNIAGGDRRTCRTMTGLARHAVTHACFGGWDIIECRDAGADDVRAVTVWAPRIWTDRGMPRTSAQWQRLVDDCIRFEAGQY